MSYILVPKGTYLFSANGASSIVAWGNAPGYEYNFDQSAEGAIHPKCESIREY